MRFSSKRMAVMMQASISQVLFASFETCQKIIEAHDKYSASETKRSTFELKCTIYLTL